MREDANKDSIHSAVDFGKIAIWHHLRWLIADTNLEAGRTPVDELNSAFGLKVGDSAVDFFWNNIATVEETCRHVFAVARVAFHHLVMWLEAGA